MASGMSWSLAGMSALGARLGQGQAREAGTEKSDVSGISLSRAVRSIAYALARASVMTSATAGPDSQFAHAWWTTPRPFDPGRTSAQSPHESRVKPAGP
jgi:hypothetical protein